MFKSNINPAGTRDSRINEIIAYCDIADIGKQTKIFSETGVSVKLGDHTWPELPWSEFDDNDLRHFELQVEIEETIRRMRAKKSE